MKDLWGDCYSGEHQAKLSPDQFRHTFCKVCRNDNCKNSLAGQSRWSRRMHTQKDILLDNPHFADPSDPRYQAIRALDFPDMLRQAMALEISAERGNWEIPSDIETTTMAAMLGSPVGFSEQEPEEQPDEPVVHILWEGEVKGSKGRTYNLSLASVDGSEPRWSCSCPSFIYGKVPPEGCKHIQEARLLWEGAREAIKELPEEPLEKPLEAPQAVTLPPQGVNPEQWRAMREHNLVPSRPNTRFPSEGIMVDGSAPPQASQPMSQVDDWSIPAKPRDRVVAVGARVVLGGKPSEDT